MWRSDNMIPWLPKAGRYIQTVCKKTLYKYSWYGYSCYNNYMTWFWYMTHSKKDNSLGYTIGKTNWYIKTLLSNLLRKEGLSITIEQWIVLKIISKNPGVSQTEIAEESLKDKTNITRILDLLEKGTLIERHRDSSDRRMNRIYITDKGKRTLIAISPVIQKTNEICTQSLTQKDMKELIKSLNAICMGIKNQL